jgi:hypothetical protein
MRRLLIIVLLLCLAIPALAGERGRWGLGLNYCTVSNFKAWANATVEHGTMLRVDYTYDFTDAYTVALEMAFYADNEVFQTPSVWTYPQTATVLNIDHIFHTARLGPFSPHLKFGTGIYGLNLWRKLDADIYDVATDVTADLNVGVGVEFQLWSARLNVDLDCPALLHALYSRARKFPTVWSFGLKQYF